MKESIRAHQRNRKDKTTTNRQGRKMKEKMRKNDLVSSLPTAFVPSATGQQGAAALASILPRSPLVLTPAPATAALRLQVLRLSLQCSRSKNPLSPHPLPDSVCISVDRCRNRYFITSVVLSPLFTNSGSETACRLRNRLLKGRCAGAGLVSLSLVSNL